MDGEWYCKIAGREIGPLQAQQLRAMAASGQILPTDSIRRGATGQWTPASHVKGLFAAPAQPPLPEAPGPMPPLPEIARRSPPLPRAQPLDDPIGSALGGVANIPDAASSLGDVQRAELGIRPLYARKQRQQQQRLVGSLVVVGVGLLLSIVVLVFARGGGSSPDVPLEQPKSARPTTVAPLTAADNASADVAPSADAAVPPKAAAAPPEAVKKNAAAKAIRKERDEPLRPPTGNPEEDFGIKMDAAPPASTPPSPVQK